MSAAKTRGDFLAELPLSLNSSLETRNVVSDALLGLENVLEAEASTVFLLNDCGTELEFWAINGGEAKLGRRRIPADKGIVGWVIEQRKPLLVSDARSDPRFFSEVDCEGGFHTRDIICAPLAVRGGRVIGALQVLNSRNGFSEADLEYLVACSRYIAPAVENAELYRKLWEQNARLEALDKKKGEAAAIIAHEFRTPLSIIRSAAEMLPAAPPGSEMQRTLAQTLDRGVERLSRVVAQISNLALAVRGETDLRRTALVVQELFEQIRSQFAPIAESREIAFAVSAPTEPLQVSADYGLLLIVLTNLLSNAIRFTPNGGRVNLSADTALGLVTIAVTDTGIGIAPEEQRAIFEKFYEGQSAALHSSGTYQFRSCGLGLGLSTAETILKAHGSAIELESMPGEGSSFRFNLPLLS